METNKNSFRWLYRWACFPRNLRIFRKERNRDEVMSNGSSPCLRNYSKHPRKSSDTIDMIGVTLNFVEQRWAKGKKVMKASQINKSLTGILYRNPAWTRSIPKDIAGFLIYKNNSVNIQITINYRLPGFSFPFKNCNEIMISLDVRMKIKQRDNPRKYRGQQF